MGQLSTHASLFVATSQHSHLNKFIASNFLKYIQEYSVMDTVTNFLESSTIHGLVYMSTEKKRFVKIFWILVVIGGFTGAGVMIYNSFQSWAESPVKTTIETHPVTEITRASQLLSHGTSII